MAPFGLRELKENSYGCDIIGFILIWLRESWLLQTPHHLLVHSFSKPARCWDEKKNKIQCRSLKSSLSRVRDSASMFLSGPISLSSAVPSSLVYTVQEVALLLEAVRPYLLTLPHFQSLRFFASGFNSSIKLIYSSCQEEDKFSSQPFMRKALEQMNNC